jgi:DNA ligase (NAD+)
LEQEAEVMKEREARRHPEQLCARIEHFVSPRGLDIDGLDTPVVKQLVDRGIVQNRADLFGIKKRELVRLHGMTEGRAQSLLDEVAVSKKISLPRLLYALGIPHVDRILAQVLSAEFGSVRELAAAGRERLSAVEEVETASASAIADWFAHPSNISLLRKLKECGIDPTVQRAGRADNKSGSSAEL